MELLINPKLRWLRHLLFIGGVRLSFLFFMSYDSSSSPIVPYFSLMLWPLTVITSYIIVYWLIPRYLLQQQLLKFTILLVTLVCISAILIIGALMVSIAFVADVRVEDIPLVNRNYAYLLTLVYLNAGLASFLSLWKRYYLTGIEKSDLQKKILESEVQLKTQELDQLKQQLHPHFLFNTLNTLYGFALKQSPETPELIMKLSNLLDYILYQVKKPKVTLAQELKHLEDYIDLEKVRFRDTLDIAFEKKVLKEVIPIAPMMLLPFVENAFKHGPDEDGQLQVKALLQADHKSVKFELYNSCPKKEFQPGIGLENIKKRLALLYPDQHHLQIASEGGSFEVTLHIFL